MATWWTWMAAGFYDPVVNGLFDRGSPNGLGSKGVIVDEENRASIFLVKWFGLLHFGGLRIRSPLG